MEENKISTVDFDDNKRTNKAEKGEKDSLYARMGFKRNMPVF